MPRKSTADVTAPGVTANRIGEDRWEVRWRDRAPKVRSREFVFIGPMEGVEGVRTYVSEIAAAIGSDGPGMFDTARDRKAVLRPAADVHEGIRAFIAARTAAGRFTGKTGTTYTSYALRFVENLRAVAKIPEGDPVPVTALTRAHFDGIMGRDRAREASAIVAYQPLLLAVNAWKWMADDPARWPQTPPPPTDGKAYLPRTPKYTRTVAPTLAQVDAMIRHLPPKTTIQTKMLAIMLRYTGLRSETILAIQREDIDLSERTLFVREDKNAWHRIVPLADGLVEEIRDYVNTIDSGTIFPKRRHTRRNEAAHKQPTTTFRIAWEAATAAGLTPRHVWAPPNRTNARPEHALRAAFDAYLIGSGVPAPDVNYLVGREEGDVRSVHYSGEFMERMREAVNRIPCRT